MQRMLSNGVALTRWLVPRRSRRDEYGARGVDLANLVFEPPANHGSAIQADYCRPSGI